MSNIPENRLKNSASPYLRSAAHQPVDWHEWGEEAFAKARAANKPLLLDIGAVWCHWCHVIDRESYENPEIAAMINKLYIPVKVDRDERPDVDSRYQSAISAISGQGGWPLTAFLTPDGKPFYGGTYFPPEDSMGRPGFKRILLSIAEAFDTRRKQVDESAESPSNRRSRNRKCFMARAAHSMPASWTRSLPRPSPNSTKRRAASATPRNFRTLPPLIYCSSARNGPMARKLQAVAEKTLNGMAAGGFHDQIGGGFHRYSVDERWCVPHFEKMSYDNSELLKNYLHGYQVHRERPVSRSRRRHHRLGHAGSLRSKARRLLRQPGRRPDARRRWRLFHLDCRRGSRSPFAGGMARRSNFYYDIGPRGEMHHNPEKNVLWIAAPIEAIRQKLKLREDEVTLLLASAKRKLLAARLARRPTPAVDETLYVGWNAMFVSAYLEAAQVLGRADCREFALKTLDRILAEAWDLRKVFSIASADPRSKARSTIRCSLPPRCSTPMKSRSICRYFEIAERAMRLAVERFGDPDGGGFFDRAKDAAPMGGLDVRRKPMQDSPTPGANSVAAIVLDRLYAFTGEKLYRDWAEKTLEAFVGLVPQYGLFAATYGLAALLHARHPLQVVITGAAGDPQAAELEKAAHEIYRFGKAVLRVTPEQIASGSLAPALRETLPHLDAAKPQALVCIETTCHPPISRTRSKLTSLLAEIAVRAEAAR